MKSLAPLLLLFLFLVVDSVRADEFHDPRVATVMNIPGVVAFWDFVRREPQGDRRFTAHVPPAATNEYPLDAGNYVAEYWGEGLQATDADFPLLGRGPFGNAIRIRRESDPTFRPYLFVPRTRLHDSSLDIKGAGRSVSVVVWAMQGHWHRLPGLQPGEDPDFPPDQFYNPPEEKPVAVQVVAETADERVERREYGYTKIEVTLQKGADGRFTETARDLVALRLNPWWFPHDLYAPPDDGSGGPFTIGRVIHSSRSIGFTGWIGGVAVFDRALSSAELQRLAALCELRPDPMRNGSEQWDERDIQP
jgi:hypothetical protein